MAPLTYLSWVWAPPVVADTQGSLVCCSSWGSKESDMTERLNWIELNHNFFIHSSVDRHLGSFHVLAIVNAAMNARVHVSFPIMISSHLSFLCTHQLRGAVTSSMHSRVVIVMRDNNTYETCFDKNTWQTIIISSAYCC